MTSNDVDYSGKSGQTRKATDPLELLAPFPEAHHLVLAPLAVSDLRICSQVSRSWRKAIATRLYSEKLTACVRRSCRDVCHFNSQLESVESSLINSLRVCIQRDHEDCFNCLGPMEAVSFSCHFSILPLRYLDFYVNSCEATQQLMRRILFLFRFVVEELTLTYDLRVEGVSLLPDEVVTLPKLKVLELKPPLSFWPYDMFKIIRTAPRLNSVKGEAYLYDMQLFKCERLDVFTNVHILPFREVDKTLELLVRAQPNLTVLQIHDIIEERIIPKSWLPHLLQLLQQCSLTLQRLSVCAVYFLRLQKAPFLLEKLNFLELFLPEDSTIEDFRRVIHQLNLQASCPNVRKLRFTSGDNYCIHEISLNLSSQSTLCVPVHSVREIITENSACAVAVVEECLSSFPMLLTFGFEMLACAEICENMDLEHWFEIYRIWTELPMLEELRICLVSPKYSPEPHSLDALFCGISVDEATAIKSSSGTGQNDLLKFQFCPIRPTLLYAPYLKKVSLVISPNYRPKACCTPELSKYLVFSRKPMLQLLIESHCSRITEELRVMESFAKITSVTERCDWW